MTSILTPVLALVCLSLLVWIWMYATRIPAMTRTEDRSRRRPCIRDRWTGCRPRSVRWPTITTT